MRKRPTSRRAALTVALATMAALAAAAPAARAAHMTVELPEEAMATLAGAPDVHGTGYSVDPAGDVNGDGVDDMVVGTHDNTGDDNLGRAYVVFGGPSGDMDLGAIGTRGFEIVGSQHGAFLGFDVAGAGDLNADGLDDVLVGEPWADRGGLQNAGSVYVIFGKSDTTTVDAAALGAQGIRIDGATDNAYFGSSVSSAGDVDGDGIPDVVAGAPFEGPDPLDAPDPDRAGRAYVLFGKSLTQSVDLAAGPFDGFRVDGTRHFEYLGRSVSMAGDQNGDGLGDLIVGAPGVEDTTGAAYVVYGKETTEPVSTLGLEPGENGFTVSGVHVGDEAGYSVDGGEDVDGDGLSDLVVGAPRLDVPAGEQGGAAFVIRGSSTRANVPLTSPNVRVTRIAGAEAFDNTGFHVAFAPHETSTDVLIGSREGRIGSPGGSVHLVFDTGAAGESFELDRIGHRGFAFEARQQEGIGISAALVGDVDADAVPDYAIGAPGAKGPGGAETGAVYLAHSPEGSFGEPPPRARFISFASSQPGELGSYCWDGVCVDRQPTFPDRVHAGRRALAAIVFDVDAKPESFSLTAHRELDEFGRPADIGERLRVQWEPVRGGAGYRAVFRLPDGAGDIYLIAAGSWTGIDRGDATWFFHLDLGRPYVPMRYPPNAALHTGGDRQTAGRTAWKWTDCSALGGCTTTFTDFAARTEPLEAIEGRRGGRAFIRISSRTRPDHVVLSRYARLRNHYPHGRIGAIRTSWRRSRVDGRTVWDLALRLPASGRFALYVLDASWSGHGAVPYDFRVKLR